MGKYEVNFLPDHKEIEVEKGITLLEVAEKAKTLETLRALSPIENKSSVLERLAEFLRNVTKAWKDAGQEQRNRLARQLFEEIWVKDKQVIAVKPRPELKPFFQLSYEEWLKKFESENSNPLGSPEERLGKVTTTPALCTA